MTLERDALSIRSYESVYIPGPLQSPNYVLGIYLTRPTLLDPAASLELIDRKRREACTAIETNL